MGDQKTTVELEKPPAWAIEMSQRMADGFASLNARLDTVETNVSVLVDDKKTMNERLSRLETWKENEVNTRLNANSERVKGESEVNLKQDAAIAQIMTDVAALKDTIGEVKNLVTGFFKNPKVRFVGQVIFVIATAYAAGKGIKVLP